MPESVVTPTNMSDDELEAANQALMRERATVLARQRDIAAEVERRAKGKRLAVLAEALAAEGIGPDTTGGLLAAADTQVLDAGDIAGVADVFPPGG